MILVADYVAGKANPTNPHYERGAGEIAHLMVETGRQGKVLKEIIMLLENDLPEAKENILKILIARKQMKEGLNALGLTGS